MKSPIKYSLKSELLSIILVILSFALGIYFYPLFPAKIASHWNFQGQIDGYSDNVFGAFGLPAIIFGLYVMFLILPLIDPKKDRYPEFATTYHIFKTLIIGVMFLLFVFTGLFNIGIQLPIGIIVPLLIGSLMMVIGNFMGKIKPNWLMGIRTPWTLSSDVVWNKTHRMGGVMFIIFGLIIAISPFLGKTLGEMAFVIGTALIVCGTFVYSLLIYNQEKSGKRDRSEPQ
jgi:uncharacterized membrane protein